MAVRARAQLLTVSFWEASPKLLQHAATDIEVTVSTSDGSEQRSDHGPFQNSQGTQRKSHVLVATHAYGGETGIRQLGI